MKSLILQTATRYLVPLMVLYSIFLLVGGHHEPGGGFIGGLLTAAAVSMCALAFDAQTARQVLYLEPHQLIGLGLLLSAGSGLAGPLAGRPFLTGLWAKLGWPGSGALEVGTPLLFDFGVYFVVIGVTLMILLALIEDKKWT